MHVGVCVRVCMRVCVHACVCVCVQICHHSGPGTDPDSRDSSHAFSSCQLTSKFVSTYFKGVEATPSIVEPCLYSVSCNIAHIR